MTLHPRLGLPQQVARRQQSTASAEPIRPPRQCLPQFLPSSLALDLEDTLTGCATKEGHLQALAGLGFFSAPVGIGPCLSSACQMPRFLLSQLQMALPQAITETCTKARGIRLVLETRQDIIGKPEPIRFAPTLTTPPTLAPAIQDIMAGDMRKERREHRALGRPDLCGLHESLFHDSGLSPPADQAPDALVSTPLPEKLPPPLVVHRVAKAADVGLDEVVHPLLRDRPSQHIQALVRTPLGAIAIAAVCAEGREQRVDHPLGGPLPHRVLEAAHPQRATRLTARLRNRQPPFGLRTVSHPLQASRPILEIRLPIPCVPRLGHRIDAHGFMAREPSITGPSMVEVGTGVIQGRRHPSGVRSRLVASPCEVCAHRGSLLASCLCFPSPG